MELNLLNQGSKFELMANHTEQWKGMNCMKHGVMVLYNFNICILPCVLLIVLLYEKVSERKE